MIATYKEYDFPDDKGYKPIHVGKDLELNDLGICGDNSGDNISFLNKSFSELTGVYWIWKNNESDYVGLVHYRRYFKPIIDRSVIIKGKGVASSRDLLNLTKNYDVIIPRRRCYVVDTIQSHYNNAHYEHDLKASKAIISECCPEYLTSFDVVMNGRCMSPYNIFFMNRENFSSYCSWLFQLLFKLEKVLPYKNYPPYQGRVFGFLAERLFNVWLEHNKYKLKIKRLPIKNIEGENLLLKGIALLKRKYLVRK